MIEQARQKNNISPNHSNNANESVSQKMRHRRRAIRGFAAEMAKRRTLGQKFADWLTRFFGSISFVVFNLVLFSGWVLWNVGLIPGLESFDPFPFGFLTMIVSLEAIFLAVFVLISQNRESQINDLREEVDLQINLIAEEEITKILALTSKLYDHLGVPVEDPELQSMMKPLNTKEIEERIREQLNIR